MEIEDRIANTELVVSPRRGGYSDMFYVPQGGILLMREVYGGVQSEVEHIWHTQLRIQRHVTGANTLSEWNREGGPNKREPDIARVSCMSCTRVQYGTVNRTELNFDKPEWDKT